MKIMFFDTETGGKDAKKCDIYDIISLHFQLHFYIVASSSKHPICFREIYLFFSAKETALTSFF